MRTYYVFHGRSARTCPLTEVPTRRNSTRRVARGMEQATTQEKTEHRQVARHHATFLQRLLGALERRRRTANDRIWLYEKGATMGYGRSTGHGTLLQAMPRTDIQSDRGIHYYGACAKYYFNYHRCACGNIQSIKRWADRRHDHGHNHLLILQQITSNQ